MKNKRKSALDEIIHILEEENEKIENEEKAKTKFNLV